MRKNKLFTLSVTFLALCFTAGIALAANQVVLTTTVPNIPKSACEQAGAINYGADDQTAIHEGDVIQHTLSNNVSICKQIDYYLALVGPDNGPNGAAWDWVLSTLTSDPVTTTTAGGTLEVYDDGSGDAADNGATWDIGFLVTANVGDQIVNLQLGRRDLVTGLVTAVGDLSILYVAATPADSLNIKLFDEKAVANFHWRDDVLTLLVKDYLITPTLPSDNVLCINTLNYTFDIVSATPDSIVVDNTYKLTFSGDYSIAFILAANPLLITHANKEPCPIVPYGFAVDQFGNPISAPDRFDPGNYNAALNCVGDRWASTNTCSPNPGNGILISRSTSFDLNTAYTIKLTLLIDGSPAQNVVTWNNLLLGGAYYATQANNPGISQCGSLPLSTPLGGTESLDISGTILTLSNLSFGAAYTAVVLDLPFVLFNSLAVDNAEIGVRVEIDKFPCAATPPVDLCLGTFIEECTGAIAAADCYMLTFPYATPAASATYWVGLSVTNVSDTDGTALLTFYDKAGGVGTLTVPIIARGMFLESLGSVVQNLDPGSTIDPDENLQLIVNSDVNTDGILMIGTYSGNAIHGYLPRLGSCP